MAVTFSTGNSGKGLASAFHPQHVILFFTFQTMAIKQNNLFVSALGYWNVK